MAVLNLLRSALEAKLLPSRGGPPVAGTLLEVDDLPQGWRSGGRRTYRTGVRNRGQPWADRARRARLNAYAHGFHEGRGKLGGGSSSITAYCDSADAHAAFEFLKGTYAPNPRTPITTFEAGRRPLSPSSPIGDEWTGDVQKSACWGKVSQRSREFYGGAMGATSVRWVWPENPGASATTMCCDLRDCRPLGSTASRGLPMAIPDGADGVVLPGVDGQSGDAYPPNTDDVTKILAESQSPGAITENHPQTRVQGRKLAYSRPPAIRTFEFRSAQRKQRTHDGWCVSVTRGPGPRRCSSSSARCASPTVKCPRWLRIHARPSRCRIDS
jgi:hypothetical protein